MFCVAWINVNVNILVHNGYYFYYIFFACAKSIQHMRRYRQQNLLDLCVCPLNAFGSCTDAAREAVYMGLLHDPPSWAVEHAAPIGSNSSAAVGIRAMYCYHTHQFMVFKKDKKLGWQRLVWALWTMFPVLQVCEL